MKDIIKQYEKKSEAIAEKFCGLMGYSEYHWIGDHIGGLCEFNEYYTYDMEDMIEVLVTFGDQDKRHQDLAQGIVHEWYDFVLDCMDCGLNYVNLHHWLMGFYTTPNYSDMKASIKRIKESKEVLDSLTKEAKETYGEYQENGFPKRFKTDRHVESKD